MSSAAPIRTHFSDLAEPRINRSKLLSLLDIIGLTICGVISGAEARVEIEHYGQRKIKIDLLT